MNVFVKLFAELNLGDDLFLKILIDRYPNIKFILRARDEYKIIFGQNNNLEIRQDLFVRRTKSISYKVASVLRRTFYPSSYKNLLVKLIKHQYLNDFESSDVFVSIGGSIFIQPKTLPYYTDVEYYNIVGREFQHIFFLGCNFGPYTDTHYLNNYRQIFSKATDVCFRDEKSWKLFSDLDNVRYRPDIVFGLEFPKSSSKEKSVGFSVVSARNGINKDAYLKKYAEIVSSYQKAGYEIYFFSFCKKQGDEDTIEEIIKLLVDDNNINRVYYNGKIDEFVSIYSSIKKMYCGRFHSMILSMIFDQEIYPIAYSKKMNNVLNDIGYEGEIIEMEDFHLINPENLDSQISRNSYDIENVKRESINQFEKLDLILKR